MSSKTLVLLLCSAALLSLLSQVILAYNNSATEAFSDLSVGNISAKRDLSHNAINTIINGISPTELRAMTEVYVQSISKLSAETAVAKQSAANLASQLAISEDAVVNFFTLIRREQVPLSQLKPRLAEIAISYNDLVLYFDRTHAGTGPNEYSTRARQAILKGDFDLAEQELRSSEYLISRYRRTQQGVLQSSSESIEATTSDISFHLFERGLISLIRSDYESASTLFEEAFTLASKNMTIVPCSIQQYPLFRARALSALVTKSGNDLTLQQTIEIRQQAIDRLVKEHCPIGNWSDTHIEQGRAYTTLANHQGDANKLNLAIKHYKLALDEKALPLSYARWFEVQSLVGHIYWKMGNAEAAFDSLQQSIYSEMRKERPLQWASTQVVIGMALVEKSKHQPRFELEAEAVQTFEEVLKIAKQDIAPDIWATAQFGLGSVYLAQGLRSNGVDRLELAVATLRTGLSVFTPDRDLSTWARLQLNLATALGAIGDMTSAKESYREAMSIYMSVSNATLSGRELLLRKEALDGYRKVQDGLYRDLRTPPNFGQKP